MRSTDGSPSSSAIQLSIASRKVRSRLAMAGAFVSRMPVPMSTLPRARRVMSAQPVAASPRATGQSRDGSPASATASTSATAATSGR